MRILIVDDEKPARDRLRQLVDDFGDHEVVGEAANGEQAIAIAAQSSPDIVLLDIPATESMPAGGWRTDWSICAEKSRPTARVHFFL